VIFGRDVLRVAGELIALYDPHTAERIATYQIKRLAFRITPDTAATLSFWAGVLAHSGTLVLRPGEETRLFTECSPDRLIAYALWERRSMPQAAKRSE
jgi:hypothetical protein